MLFPGYRPAVFDDIPITAIITNHLLRGLSFQHQESASSPRSR